jgi:hypothetical protein
MPTDAEYCHKCGQAQSSGKAAHAAPTRARHGGPSPGAYLGGLALIVVASWIVPPFTIGLERDPSAVAYSRHVTVVIFVGTLIFGVWAAANWQWFQRRHVLTKAALGVTAWFALNFVLYGVSILTSVLVAPVIGQAILHVRRAASAFTGTPDWQTNLQRSVVSESAQSIDQQARPTVAATPTREPSAEPSPTSSPSVSSAQTVGTMYISADGDGAYVRRTPNLEDRYMAWPDGTSVVVLEYVSADWARVRAPDGYIGYIPRRYIAEMPPKRASPVGPATQGTGPLAISVDNLRSEKWGAPLTSNRPCGPYNEGWPTERLIFDLTVRNLTAEYFGWDFQWDFSPWGFNWDAGSFGSFRRNPFAPSSGLAGCCYAYGPEVQPPYQGGPPMPPMMAPPLPKGGSAALTCFVFPDEGAGDTIGIAWTDRSVWRTYQWSWKIANRKMIAQQ